MEPRPRREFESLVADALDRIPAPLAELDGKASEADVRELKPRRGPSSAGG